MRSNPLNTFRRGVIDNRITKHNSSMLYIIVELKNNSYLNFILCRMNDVPGAGIYIIRKTRNHEIVLPRFRDKCRSEGNCNSYEVDCCSLPSPSWRTAILTNCTMHEYLYLGSYKGYDFSCQKQDSNFSIPYIELIERELQTVQPINQTIAENKTLKYGLFTHGPKIIKRMFGEKSETKNNNDSGKRMDEFIVVLTFVGPSVGIVFLIAGTVAWKMRQNVKKHEREREREKAKRQGMVCSSITAVQAGKSG